MTGVAGSTTWRWAILFVRVFTSFLSLGLFKAMGVFIPYFVDEFETSVVSVGLATSLYGSICSIIAPVASAMMIHGPRRLAFVGSAIMAGCTLAAATSTSVFQLNMWLALSSVGQSFQMVASLKLLVDYFPNSFATANGIGLSAGTLGMMILPPVTEWMIQIYGWRGTLVLLGGVTFNLCACAGLMRPLKSRHVSARNHGGDYRQIGDLEDSRDRGSPEAIREDCRSFWSMMRERFEVRLFVSNRRFLPYLTASFMIGAVFSGWHLFLVPHAIALGYEEQTSSFLSTYGGMGSFLGRIMNGVLVDHKIITPFNLFLVTAVVYAISSLLDPLAVSSFVALSTLATISGVCMGFNYPLTFVIVRDLAPDSELAAFGWLLLFLGFGQIGGGVVSGWVYDLTRDYNIVFIIYGVVSLAIIPLMTVPGLIARMLKMKE